MNTNSSRCLVLLYWLKMTLLNHFGLFAVCSLYDHLDIRTTRLYTWRPLGFFWITIRVWCSNADVFKNIFTILSWCHCWRCSYVLVCWQRSLCLLNMLDQSWLIVTIKHFSIVRVLLCGLDEENRRFITWSLVTDIIPSVDTVLFLWFESAIASLILFDFYWTLNTWFVSLAGTLYAILVEWFYGERHQLWFFFCSLFWLLIPRFNFITLDSWLLFTCPCVAGKWILTAPCHQHNWFRNLRGQL